MFRVLKQEKNPIYYQHWFILDSHIVTADWTHWIHCYR